MDAVTTERRALRDRLVQARLGLDPAVHRSASEAISRTLKGRLGPAAGRRLAAYWPYRGEYDPMPVARDWLADGGEAALPKVVGRSRPLEFHRWHPDLDMLIGLYEIPYPAGGVAVDPDIILAPLIGFDGARYRLGYGGGYYDRTLGALSRRTLSVGVGFECGRVASIAPQPHDVKLDIIVTEAGVFE